MGMSQPPKSTILAPSARWLSLSTVLRLMARSLVRECRDYPRSIQRGPVGAGRSVMVMGAAAVAVDVAGVAVIAVGPLAVIHPFDLQGRVADVEALTQHGCRHVP